MEVKEALPYVGMVSVEVLLTGLIIASKQAIGTGMNNCAYLFYTNAMCCLIVFLASFIVYRSRPALNFSVVFNCFLLGIIGSVIGLKYVPASFASAMFNIIPGLIFILAAILRMEKVEWGSSSTLAKCIGIVVSISGATFATLYQGHQLQMHPSILLHGQLIVPETNMFLGGSLIALQCAVGAIFVITQALILKNYSEELVILFFFFLSVTVISFAFSLGIEGEQISWSLSPTSRLVAVLFAVSIVTNFPTVNLR